MTYLVLYGNDLLTPDGAVISALIKLPDSFREFTKNNKMEYSYDLNYVHGFEHYTDSVYAIDIENNKAEYVAGDKRFLVSAGKYDGKYYFCEDYDVLTYSGDDDTLAKLEYYVR